MQYSTTHSNVRL